MNLEVNADDLGVALVALVMVGGLLGTLVPLVPGLPLIWAAGLVYGLMAGFSIAGWIALALMTALLVAGMIAKFVLPGRRPTAEGAPKSTLVAAALLGVAGFFIVPIVGLPLGAVLGVLLAERRRTGEWKRARRSTREVAVGFGMGTLVELAAGAAMIASWAAWVLVTT